MILSLATDAYPSRAESPPSWGPAVSLRACSRRFRPTLADRKLLLAALVLDVLRVDERDVGRLRAHEAQLYVAESLAYDKKDSDAVVAYDRVISNYPGSASVPLAYYKRGLALQRLGEEARARESFEAVLKQFPDSSPATLAKQRLDGMKPAR